MDTQRNLDTTEPINPSGRIDGQATGTVSEIKPSRRVDIATIPGVRHRGAAAVDVAVELAGYAIMLALTLLGFLYAHHVVGDNDAGAPGFIKAGNKLLLVLGALIGTGLGALLAFLMRRAVAGRRRRTARLELLRARRAELTARRPDQASHP